MVLWNFALDVLWNFVLEFRIATRHNGSFDFYDVRLS